ncbi:hypothetical protein [Streptomyces sp. NPDC091212]|uniref:hypothetical protein n=1 Tax=Streptomyces sp. NPDC091212 TaxID=3155191 RepID=UPI003432CAE8
MVSDEAGLIALHKVAEDFAEELTATLSGVLPRAPRFHAFRTGRKLWVTTVAGEASELTQSRIELYINGEPELTLAMNYYCCWDQAAEFLAVDKSTLALHYRQDPEPLLRYEPSASRHLPRRSGPPACWPATATTSPAGYIRS